MRPRPTAVALEQLGGPRYVDAAIEAYKAGIDTSDLERAYSPCRAPQPSLEAYVAEIMFDTFRQKHTNQKRRFLLSIPRTTSPLRRQNCVMTK